MHSTYLCAPKLCSHLTREICDLNWIIFSFLFFSVSDTFVSGRNFMGKNDSATVVDIKRCAIFASFESVVILCSLGEFKLIYPGCILFWICCLSIGSCAYFTFSIVTTIVKWFQFIRNVGRQWFLDMEINPQKYVDHYKSQSDTTSVWRLNYHSRISGWA